MPEYLYDNEYKKKVQKLVDALVEGKISEETYKKKMTNLKKKKKIV